MTALDDYRVRDGRRFVENLEDELRYTAPGRPLPALDAIEGTDASGTVYCIVGLDGRPNRVIVADGWWEAVGPNGVASAVLQAYRYAGEKATLAKMLLRRSGREWRIRLPHSDEAPEVMPYPTGHASMDDIDRLRRRIDDTADSMGRAMRLNDLITGSGRWEVHGPRGMFMLTLRGAVIESAQVTAPRLYPDSAAELAADALEALTAARTGRAIPGER